VTISLLLHCITSSLSGQLGSNYMQKHDLSGQPSVNLFHVHCAALGSVDSELLVLGPRKHNALSTVHKNMAMSFC